jgi:cellulase/cellobiase CelA1
MRVEITPELVDIITRSVRTWKRHTEPLDDKEQHYDTFCEETYGLKIDFFTVDGKVHVGGATVIDEDKYIEFLLTYGNMPE